MTPEQRTRFNGLLSEVINAAITGEPYARQLAREDHLRNYVDGLMDEKDATVKQLETRLRNIKRLANAPLDTEDERHVHMKISKAKPAPIVIEDDEVQS